MVRTLSAISEFNMRRLLRGTKRIEHLGPASPNPESEEEAQTQAKERPDSCMGANLTGSTFQSISVRVLQVMLEMFFGELADVFARVLAKHSKGVGGHSVQRIRVTVDFSITRFERAFSKAMAEK